MIFKETEDAVLFFNSDDIHKRHNRRVDKDEESCEVGVSLPARISVVPLQSSAVKIKESLSE